MTEHTDDERRLEREHAIADRMHDREFEFSQSAAQAALSNANFALRTLILINGGAAVAMLAFISSLATRPTVNLATMTAPLVWFVWGIVSAGFSVCFAYFTNYCIATSSSMKDRIWQHPWVSENSKSERWRKTAVWWQYLAVIAALLSLGLFIKGMLEVREAITLLG